MDRAARWAWAEIDLAALEHNVRHLTAAVAPAELWAVVKADGYGHGAVAVAERALASGASGLCVALAQEGVALREAGISAPILVLSQQPAAQLADMVAADLTPTVYTTAGVDELAIAHAATGGRQGFDVHVKVDTGMHRVGVGPAAVAALVDSVVARQPGLRLAGVYTHLACADEPDSPVNAHQLAIFDLVLGELATDGQVVPRVHAANSAAALSNPASHHDMVRVGIAMYGISPGSGVDEHSDVLRPVLSLRARVSHVQQVAAGEGISYGWRYRCQQSTTIATVPVGYGDGVSRRLGTLPDRSGADVLIGGARCPIVGVVTMDQLMVDVTQFGEDHPVAVGDEVVLIGEQGDQAIRVEEWADRLGTIGYEVVCAIGARVPRVVRT